MTTNAKADKVLFVKGARRLRYAAVIDAMDVARGAGVKVIGLP
jgi:biopolymer transport protein ExbD